MPTMAAAYTLVYRNKNMKKYVSHNTCFTVTYFVRCCSGNWKERGGKKTLTDTQSTYRTRRRRRL